MSSSMLIEGDVKGELKVHDIVRAFAISFAAKEDGHKFMVEGIPYWLDDEAFNEYTAMTLRSSDDYSRLSGVEAVKLQILILKGDMSSNFDDFFFEGTVNLKVLSMSNMKFHPYLPKSIRKLKKLRTLCMERCKLGDIKQISELVTLLVLSLRESFFEELAVEMGELSKLWLLDLTGCTCGKATLIPAGILNRLSKLEGLYLSNTIKHGVSVFGTEFSNGEKGAIYKYTLPRLNALNASVPVIEGLPFDAQSFQNIDKFRVSIADYRKDDDAHWSFNRVLYLQNIDDPSQHLGQSCLKPLLKRADYLKIEYAGGNIEHIVPMLDHDGFKDLRSLEINYSHYVKCIVNGHAMNTLTVFPCLESLNLSFLRNLKVVCDGEASTGMFCKLKTLYLLFLEELSYGLPLVPRNLMDISVSYCGLLNFIFLDDEETRVIELFFLKTLRLDHVTNLLSLVGPKVSSIDCDTLPRDQFFFDGKIMFPALETFKMKFCNKIVKLWSKESCGFQNLKKVTIKNCQTLLIIGSPSLFSTLVHLESLRIYNCHEMREVITEGEEEALEICEQIISLPQLKLLKLVGLSNLSSFYGGKAKFEFPKLKKLILYDLPCVTSFVKLENSSSLFHEMIDFSSLEELQVRHMSNEVTGLWNSQASNPAPKLRHIELGTTKGLRHMPSIILKNLSSLKLVDFEYDDVLFSSSNARAKEQFIWKYSELPKLEGLDVVNSNALKELLNSNDYSDTNALTFCAQLKKLEVNTLPALSLIPLYLFKNLASLTLKGLKWKNLTSAELLGNSLQQLEHLEIGFCHSMETLVTDVVSPIELPRLKTLNLRILNLILSISSSPNMEATLRLPSLELLAIDSCPQLEHFWTGSFFASKLRDLSILECDNLQQIFQGSPVITTELLSLEKVDVALCVNIKSISSGPVNALFRCYELESFLLGSSDNNGDIELRFLEVVEISFCPKLHSMLSLLPLRTSNLNHVKCDLQEYSMLPFDDLNHFLREVNIAFLIFTMIDSRCTHDGTRRDVNYSSRDKTSSSLYANVVIGMQVELNK